MTRKTINKITSSKTFLIIVSCVVSIGLWLYVVNVENTDIDIKFSGLAVQYIGQDDILADRQLIVKNDNSQSVSLTLYGKRSVLSSINKNDIIVSVDLTDVKSTGTVERIYNVSFAPGINASDIYILEKYPTYVTVEVDRMSSKTVEVKSDSDITVADGYMAEPLEFSPSEVVVSGPEELISKVSSALVKIERENLSKTVTNAADFVLIDSDGKQVRSDEITTNVDKINVTVPIVMCKEVVLTADIIEGGGAKKENAVVTISPATVTLSGPAEILSSLNQISLGTIDLSQFLSSASETFTIPISNDMNNLSGVTEATVSVSLKNLETKRVISSNIEFINISEGYTATPVTQYLEVTIRGTEEIVKLIDSYNIRIVGDLSDLDQAVGRYAVPAKVYINGYSDVGVVGDYKVVVSLEEEE